MKRWFLWLSMLAPVLGILAVSTSRGQIQGPGDGGATLRLPGAEPAAVRPQTPAIDPASPFSPSLPKAPRIAQMPSNEIGINKDIEITDKQSPWVITAMSYSGAEAPKLAREFAMELRNNPKLKLNAFVYNYGTAEKRKEYERVQELRKTQEVALKQAGVQGQIMPLRVRTIKIEEQTGVLIDGGFRTREEALEALKKLRKIDLDPKDLSQRVQLDVKVALLEEKNGKGEVKLGANEAVFINPFTRAFPARNPALPHEHEAPPVDPEDVKLMRKLNEQESFSLFQVKKPITLVVKQYNTQQVLVKSKQEQDGFLERFRKGLTLKNGQWEDHAAVNAHNLCDAFRKSGLAETYVLHTKYVSIVCVGGYDSGADPRLTQMQNHLESQFRMDGYRPYDLMPRPLPMAVPR